MISLFLQAQVPNASLSFKEKMLEIGKPTPLLMHIEHPEDMVVIFPDSGKAFLPYELVGREVRPTETANGRSVDEVTYSIRSFEIDSLQTIRLPFRYITIDGDTISEYTDPATILLLPAVPVYSDSLKLRPHTGLFPIYEPPNYLLMFVGITVLVLLLVILTILLWKPVRRKIRRWRLEKDWKKVDAKMQQTMGQISQPVSFIEQLNQIWKAYMDKTWKASLKSRTTPELKELLFQVEALSPEEKNFLYRSSEIADMLIYAKKGASGQELDKVWQGVYQLLQAEFRRRKEATR